MQVIINFFKRIFNILIAIIKSIINCFKSSNVIKDKIDEYSVDEYSVDEYDEYRPDEYSVNAYDEYDEYEPIISPTNNRYELHYDSPTMVENIYHGDYLFSISFFVEHHGYDEYTNKGIIYLIKEDEEQYSTDWMINVFLNAHPEVTFAKIIL